MASDKGGVSALRIAKHVGVSWITARNMLRKIRKALADLDSIYRLANMIEFATPLSAGNVPAKEVEGLLENGPFLWLSKPGRKGGWFCCYASGGQCFQSNRSSISCQAPERWSDGKNR
jgi:hypothetical protein